MKAYLVRELWYFIRTLVSPSCWLRVGQTSRIWDKAMRRELMNPEFTDLSSHTVKLNGKKIWIENHPYASCTIHEDGRKSSSLPSRRTVFMFYDALESWIAWLARK